MSLVQYGWTITKIDEPLYTCRGGTLDGVTYLSLCLDGAQPGEVWCLQVDPAPPFALGAVLIAHRSCAGVSALFDAGRRLDGLDHCPCD
jgi:hypothetical protein